MQLLLGCGNSREKRLRLPGDEVAFTDLVTVDMFPETKCDVVWDLEQVPLPFDDNSADEIHAYDVLEHMGRQGDWRFFFRQFEDFWRILKPGGHFFAITPHPTSPWAWGDPGHTRVIPPESVIYLSQAQYARQVGTFPMTDYRPSYKADFKILNNTVTDNGQTVIVLEALK